MAITETRDIVLAEVEVTDRYSVDVHMRHVRVELTPEQARDLANELVDAADAADTMQDTDKRSNESKLHCELEGII